MVQTLFNETVNLIKKPFTFLFEWRPYSPFRFFMYFFMFSSVPMFYYGINTYDFDFLLIILYSIIVFYTGFFAVIIWNDICDSDIDTIIHPKRALPMKKISSKKFFIVALIFSGLVFIFSLLVNFSCFIFVGLAALFVAFHNKYLRRKIKFPAYSEIVTPLQWTIIPIFGFLAVENSYILDMILLFSFTYLADGAHDYPEGIHDAKGDRTVGIMTFTTSFNERIAAIISFIMLFLAGLVGIALYLLTSLSIIFLILFVSLWIYTLFYSFKYLRMNLEKMQHFGLKIGLKIYRFFWATYVFIFIDIIIQIFQMK